MTTSSRLIPRIPTCRQGTGLPPVTFREVRADELLNSAVQPCLGEARQKRISVYRVCERALMVRACAPLLERALTNVVGNAIRFSERGSVVLVEAKGSEQRVVITVRDWGAGISRRHLSRVFDPFYVVERGRHDMPTGAGLGLAVVREVAQMHGGEVRVRSIPGEGSVFSICIPRQEEWDFALFHEVAASCRLSLAQCERLLNCPHSARWRSILIVRELMRNSHVANGDQIETR